MTSKLEINKELVLSTAHITLDTAVMLDSEDCPFYVIKDAYSWRMHVQKGALIHKCDGSPELQALAKLAQDNYCNWLVLDQDADTYDELPTFDW